MTEEPNIMDPLIVRYLAGETTETEARELTDWIALRSENELYYLEYKKVFDATQSHFGKSANRIPAVDLDKEWAHFLSAKTKSHEKPVVPLFALPFSMMKMAAAFLVLLASGFIVYWFVTRITTTEYKTDLASREITLPDGSLVVLNKHSSLSYKSDFGKLQRAVSMTGEAFFEVSHDVNNPFTIAVAQTVVEVVGTSFDIRAYENNPTVDVVVTTGIVRFSAPVINKEIRLTAGEKGVFARATKTLDEAANRDVNFLAWSTRRIVFAGNDLQSVVETLNNAYGADISINTKVSATCSVTATFDHQSLEAILHVLETTLNLTITTTGSKIEITHAGC